MVPDKCTFRTECNPLTTNGTTDCWPDFYPPVKTSSGGFSILVVNKVTERYGRTVQSLLFSGTKFFVTTVGNVPGSPTPLTTVCRHPMSAAE